MWEAKHAIHSGRGEGISGNFHMMCAVETQVCQIKYKSMHRRVETPYHCERLDGVIVG